MATSIHPVIYYAVAGALIAGGPAAGIYAARQGQREAARRHQATDLENKREALSGEIELAKLREEAVAVGVDPAEVIAGYEALRDGQISPETVMEAINRGDGSA